eukprot:TRINITY_DN3923_c0_g1_i9.p2 TRINITY_DN3923_c0_g1~~TRINITY_DN3923_c0_g1_i9.p2  ORF type:complete len:208 (+),score=28.17 TRINITY_DN3923_c0_g1_i9:1496-2119(+)
MNNFDGVEVSLKETDGRIIGASRGRHVMMWVVKSSSVLIQALYSSEAGLLQFPHIRALAVSGTFLGGNVLTIGQAYDPVMWNNQSILSDMPSEFFVPDLIKGKRSTAVAQVPDRSRLHRGLEFVLPAKVRVLVTRKRHSVSFAVRMPEATDQDGLCGNFNGDSNDDTMTFLRQRNALKVDSSESLFSEWLRVVDAKGRQTDATHGVA